MSTVDRSNKRMKGDGGPIGAGGPPSDGYYGQHPPSGRYPSYGGPSGGPPMGSGYSMWQQGHPPPPHSWGHGSSGPPPPHGSMYPQRTGPPSMGPDRSNYGGAYSRGHPPPMSGPPGPGGVRRGPKPPGPPPSSRPTSKGPGQDGPPTGAPPSDGAPPPQSGYQGGYYQPPNQAPPPYRNGSYSSGPPPPMHRAAPQTYGSPPPQPNNMYGSSPARPSLPRSSPELLVGGTYGQSTTTGTDAPDFDNMFSPRAAGTQTLDDDGNSSVATGCGGSNSKDKGRGSYKCGRCGVPKKGHVCPYQPKLTRKVGEPLPEMRSAAIQVEMDEFMTLRRLNIRIQGFPESYASEPYGEDMVVGEPHQHQSMNPMSPLRPQQQQSHGHGDSMNGADNGPSPSLPTSHDPVVKMDDSG